MPPPATTFIKFNRLLTNDVRTKIYNHFLSLGVKSIVCDPRRKLGDHQYQARTDTYVYFLGTDPPSCLFNQDGSCSRSIQLDKMEPIQYYFQNNVLNNIHPFSRNKPKKTKDKESNIAIPKKSSKQEIEKNDDKLSFPHVAEKENVENKSDPKLLPYQMVSGKKCESTTLLPPPFVLPAFELSTENTFTALTVEEDEDDSTYPCVVFQDHITTNIFLQETLETESLKKDDFSENDWVFLTEEAATIALTKEDVLISVKKPQQLVRNKYLLDLYSKKMALFRIVRTKFYAELQRFQKDPKQLFQEILGREGVILSVKDVSLVIQETYGKEDFKAACKYAMADIALQITSPNIYHNDLAVQAIGGSLPIRTRDGLLSDRSIYSLLHGSEPLTFSFQDALSKILPSVFNRHFSLPALNQNSYMSF